MESLSRELFYRVWSEDMDVAKEASFMIVGRRAGMTEKEVLDCIEVSIQVTQAWATL